MCFVCNKFTSEVEALRLDKANFSSNDLGRLDASSTGNIGVVLLCLKLPLSLFHANAEDEEGNDEDADENDADKYSSLSMLAIFTTTLTVIKSKKLFRKPYS